MSIVNEALYPMRIVVSRTGMTSHLVRAWERRYGAVVPHRTGTNRRLYTDGDIHRLLLLRRAVEHGHSISQVAALSDSELEALTPSGPPRGKPAVVGPVESRTAEKYLELALEASVNLDAETLEELLSLGEVDLGRYTLIERVIGGLLEKVGELWRKGDLRSSQEHLTSAVVRQFLGRAITGQSAPDSAPTIVLATPSGQLHEIGSLMAMNIALMMGWRVVYLGPDLPAEEIASAARQRGARAVGLSVVYPSGNARTRLELERVRRLLPPETALLVGGRAAASYADGEPPGTVFVRDLEDLQLNLERLG